MKIDRFRKIFKFVASTTALAGGALATRAIYKQIWNKERKYSTQDREGDATGDKSISSNDGEDSGSECNKLSILVICQYYYPEPFRISDICEELVKRGHEVMVVTGEPNYPEGIRYEGYEHGKRTDEIINGVRIHRCFTVPRYGGSVKRLLNYYSYAASSTAYVMSGKCKTRNYEPFDIIFVNQLSPIMMAEAGIAYKRMYHKQLVLYCLDIWPESLIAGGVGRESQIYKFFHSVSNRIYSSADKILVTSRMFTGYLQDRFGIKENVIKYFPQYAEGIFEPLPAKKPNGYTDLMFAGNIGEIQSLDTLVRAAENLKGEKVRFHIVGNGTDMNRLKKMVKEKRLEEAVIFYGRKPLEEMPKMYSMADAMIVTLKSDPVISLTLPGKVQTYMACGKPIIGAIDGETRNVIEESGCGFCGPAEDVGTLVRNILKFVDSQEKEVMSERGVHYNMSFFNRKKSIDLLEENLIPLDL